MGTKGTLLTGTGDQSFDIAWINKYNGTTAPGATDDITKGYRRGSTWQNQSVTPVAIYQCTSDTAGAAVWQLLEAGTGAEGVIVAPAASTPTGTGGNASISGGTGGATSGAGGTSSVIGGAGTAGNSAGGKAGTVGGAGQGSAAGGEADLTGGAGGATGAGGASKVTGGAGGATSGAGGAASLTGGAGTAGNSAGGTAAVAGGASIGTSAGPAASLTGGAGGTGAGGNGGTATAAGGAAGAGSNGNGGDVNLTPGAKDGTGVTGVVRNGGIVLNQQGVPGTLNATGTLTAALMLAVIVTTTSAAAVAATLDIATNMDLALPSSAASDAFDFSIINTGPNTLTVGTAAGWTLVGTMTVVTNVSGRFRARKTGAGAWTLYRLA